MERFWTRIVSFLLITIPFIFAAILILIDQFLALRRAVRPPPTEQNQKLVMIVDEFENNMTPCFLVSRTDQNLILQNIDRTRIELKPYGGRTFNTAAHTTINGQEKICDMFINKVFFGLARVIFKPNGQIEVRVINLRGAY